MAEGALADLRVVECGHGVSGPYCAKLLADLGAEVIKVEDPQGDEARRLGPFPHDVPHPEKSGLFLYLNANKLGITLDTRTTRGRQTLHQLVEDADILVENHSPRVAQELGLVYEELKEVNPRLVMVSISPFGQSGPYRDYQATELVLWHWTSVGYETPSGDVWDLESEPPLRAGSGQSYFIAGNNGAVGAMTAIFHRRLTGQGQLVDVSEQESVAVTNRPRFARHTYMHEGPGWSKVVRTLPALGIIACQDGYIAISVNEEHFYQAFLEFVGNPEWGQSELLATMPLRTENATALIAFMQGETARFTKDELYYGLQARGVPCFPVYDARDLLNYPHLRERGFFVELEHPVAGRLEYPGAPFRLYGTPWQLQRPAPLLGQHNEEIYCGRLGYSKEDLLNLRGTGVI